jgi:uncharacterized phage protein (predicted DNA packaging)
MPITLDEAKRYLRVDYDDEDSLIESFIDTAVRLLEDTLRVPSNLTSTDKVAVLFAVAYLFEHREDANMNELTRNLRYILMTEREVMF